MPKNDEQRSVHDVRLINPPPGVAKPPMTGKTSHLHAILL
jgi:hypothetical protein